ncbi:MAG TPA: ABC-2 family transporter protein [Anaerolineales bacterium]
MNQIRVFGVFLRINVLNEVAYRVNFYVQLFQSVVELATALGGLAVIFSYTGNLRGWTPDEMLALVGVYFIAGGMIGLVIQPSLEQFITAVRDGSLDFTLTKPEDAQLLASVQAVNIWKIIDIVMGAAVLVFALVRLGERIGVWQVASFGLMVLAGLVIIYSFWLMLATLSFWFVRVENILVIFQSMYQAGRWPISLYPGWLRFALTFIVPVAFATSIPAEALTGRLTLPTLLGAVALAVVLVVLSRLFWRIGLRRYSGASA